MAAGPILETAIRPDSPITEAITAAGDAGQFASVPSVAAGEHVIGEAGTLLASPGVAQATTDISTFLETKPGFKTTEFWLSLAAIAGDLGLEISTKDKAIITGLAGLYAIARGIAKNGIPHLTATTPA